jgi:4-hydroxy-tetrahydrodipicolinate synthase
MTIEASKDLRGIYAAVLTPLTDDYEPNLKAFIAHCRWLLAGGCDGLAPLGTTGEANSLSLAQRLKLIAATAEAKLPVEKFIFGSGSCALADAVTVTKAILDAGGGGALLLPPFYYKNPTEDGVYAFFAEVIERVGDSRLKLYLYHFPQLSMVPITLSLVTRLKAAYGGVIAGLKDSSGDWPTSAAMLKEFPGFGVFSGTEEFLLANLRAGGAGCISATTNLLAPLAQPIYAGWRARDVAAEQQKLTEVRRVFQDYSLHAALKEVMALLTGDAQWRNLLPPNRSLTPAQAQTLAQRLRDFPQMLPILKQAA